MRILFLSHRFPYPPTFGSKLRAFHTIRHLARSHEVTVLAPVRSPQEADEAKGIAPFCRTFRTFPVVAALQAAKVALSLPSPVTASEAFFHSAAMRREIDRLLAERRFDLVFVHCSSVGRLVEKIEGLPKIIDFCDVDSCKWRDYALYKAWPLSLGYRWEALRLAAAERRLSRAFDLVTVATPGEMQALAAIGIQSNADWFPNGVDVEYFRPSPEAHDPALITFVGRMDYFPNQQAVIDFCTTVWPQLRVARSDLRLQIVGAAPTETVKQLARLPGVSVTGAVADVRPYVTRSALTIAPLQIARGTQNKILESMAMGVPVVASRVAAGGVDAVVGEHLLVAETPAQCRDAILKVLGDPTERARLATAGRARVLSHLTWPNSMQRLDRIIERCLSTIASRCIASEAAKVDMPSVWR